jgi:glycosyltransferase involved in cell wall biosynthesis
LRIYWYWPFARSEEMGLAAAISRAGDDLTVHTLDRPGAPPRGRTDGYDVWPDLPDVEVVTERSLRWFLSRPKTYFRRAAMRRRATGPGSFDVIHIMFQNYFTDWFEARRLDRSAVLISSVHDVVPHQRRLPLRLQDALLARLYARSGHIVVHHESMREVLAGRFAVARDRVSVVPHQVPPAQPAVSPRHATSARPEVLFFGTFRRNKGIPELIDAIASLGDDERLRFRFAGRGFADVEDLVRQAAARDARISAEIGWIAPERKQALLRLADLVVLPYTSFASQSGVLHDAYSHGLPVVVTDVGALGDTVREDRTGWVVSPGSASELASALHAALNDAAAYSSAATASWAAADARHPDRVAAELRRVYERLVDDRRRSS